SVPRESTVPASPDIPVPGERTGLSAPPGAPATGDAPGPSPTIGASTVTGVPKLSRARRTSSVST
ncbi:hypothetical protein, partial [Streptomyces sp. ms184]|uniref:hypothetical protein n=1 Tax=Streptomyces sp. ms184 TaxID=1827974 RepID=UPI00359C792E